MIGQLAERKGKSKPPNQLPEIPHSVLWRRIRVALRARFYRGIRFGRGKSLGGRIFGVVFWSDSAKISPRKQSCPFALWEEVGESL
jgi:hypothetical protein